MLASRLFGRNGVLLMVTAVVFLACCNGNFIRSPTSLNVTTGTTAQLYCQADADAVFWRVNGSSLNQLNVRGIREGTTTIRDGPPLHTLYVEATDELNNIIIACIAVHFDLNVNNTLSEPALLQVQGPPSSVNNFEVTSTGRFTIHLNWIPPHTLDITGVEPDLWYIVEITNVTDPNNPTVISCGDCPLYYPAYNFTLMDNGSACDLFEFRVIPVNRAGNGSASESVTEHFHECQEQNVSEIGVNISAITVLFNKTLTVEVLLQLFNTNSYLDALTIEVLITSTGKKLLLSPTIPAIPADGTMLVEIEEGLVPNDIYLLTVYCSFEGVSSACTSTYFTTYDTQEVQLNVQNDSDISILCIFAKGSTARGCYILVFKETVVVSGTVATAEKSPVEMSLNSAKYLVPNLTMGTYSILVFDVESDRSFNPSQRPAFSAVVNVTGKLATTETTGRHVEPQCDVTAKGIGIGVIVGVSGTFFLVILIVVVVVIVCTVAKTHQKTSTNAIPGNKDVPETKPNLAYEIVKQCPEDHKDGSGNRPHQQQQQLSSRSPLPLYEDVF